MVSYEERIIAYIDILGFKALVDESKENNIFLNKIDNYLRYVYAWTTGQPNKWDSRFICDEEIVRANKASYNVNQLFCTCFSDSLAVSMPYIPSLFNEHFSTFVSNLAHIGFKFIQAGIAIRGAITIGKLVHNEKVLFGPAMNEAVDLEKKAKYPRIILSKDVIGKLQSPANPVYPYHRFLTQFNDGCVGFHQMKYIEYQHAQYIEDAKRAKGELIRNLDKQLYDTEVFVKYKWLTDELNKLSIPNDLKIKIDLTDGGQKPYNFLYEAVNEESKP